MQANGTRRASCAQISRTPVLGRCPAGAGAAAVTVDLVVKVAVKVAGCLSPSPSRPLRRSLPATFSASRSRRS